MPSTPSYSFESSRDCLEVPSETVLTVIVWLAVSKRPREEHDMELNVAQELANLRRMTPAELRVKYAAYLKELRQMPPSA